MSSIATAAPPVRRAALPVEAMLRRRRRVRVGIALFASVLLLTMVLDHCGLFAFRGDDWSNFDRRSFAVSAVDDWRTVRIGATPVRLLGVTLPAGAGAGATARTALAAAVKDRRLVLKLEPTRTRDAEGHLLAFAFVGGTDDLNVRLVSLGILSADTSTPLTFLPQLVAAERDARKHRRGCWATILPATAKPSHRHR